MSITGESSGSQYVKQVIRQSIFSKIYTVLAIEVYKIFTKWKFNQSYHFEAFVLTQTRTNHDYDTFYPTYVRKVKTKRKKEKLIQHIAPLTHKCRN